MKRTLFKYLMIIVSTIVLTASAAMASVDLQYTVHGTWERNSVVTVDVQVHNNGASAVNIQGLEMHFTYQSGKFKGVPEWYGSDAFTGNLVVDEKDLSTAGTVTYRKAKKSGYSLTVAAGTVQTIYSLKFKVTGDAVLGATGFTFNADIDDVSNTDGESVKGSLDNVTNNIVADATAPQVEASPTSVTMNASYSPRTVTLRVKSTDESGDLLHIRYTTDGSDPTESNGNTYSSAIVLAEGLNTIKFYGADTVYNYSSIYTETYTVDTQSPGFSVLSSAPAIGKAGTVVTVSFTAAEVLGADPVVTVAGGTATQYSKSGNDYVYRYTLLGTETQGTRDISVTLQDPAGNSTTNSTLKIKADFKVPTYTATLIAPTPVVIADKVTVNFTASERLVTTSTTVTIMGKAAEFVSEAAGSGEAYNYVYRTVDVLSGTETTALIVVNGTDAAGNNSQNTDGWGNITVTGRDVLGNEGTSTGNVEFIIEGQ